MFYGRSFGIATHRMVRFMAVVAVVIALYLPVAALAQDRDRDWDRDRDRTSVIEPGTTISVRTNETIDVERRSDRIYYGSVDRGVRDDSGHWAIPRGSSVELMVRVAPDNDLILDLQSVTVNGRRYTVKTDPNREEAMRDDSLVGSIVGAIGGQTHGRAVRIPRNSILTFHIERPLFISDRDSDLYGYHGYRDR